MNLNKICVINRFSNVMGKYCLPYFYLSFSSSISLIRMWCHFLLLSPPSSLPLHLPCPPSPFTILSPLLQSILAYRYKNRVGTERRRRWRNKQLKMGAETWVTLLILSSEFQKFIMLGRGGGGKRRHLWEPSDPLFHPNPSTHLPSSQEELLF